MGEGTGYRVFISYSHRDEALVARVERALADNGLLPMRDTDFAVGTGFSDQIRTFIQHAHVFLPVITTEALSRGWVHQEVGYAIALHVPMFPLAVGALPGEMLAGLQARRIDPDIGDDELRRKVSWKHARDSGCRLIIDPTIDTSAKFSRTSRIVRLRTLAGFLASMPDDKVQVAVAPSGERAHNVTLVGDWFAAESISATAGKGYRQTVFTRHAPSMRGRIEAFDQHLSDDLDRMGWKPEASRTAALDHLERLIAEL